MKRIILLILLIISVEAYSQGLIVNGKTTDTTGFIHTRSNELLVPQQYSTIQAAITAATSGMTVIVSTGTYDEKIILKDGVNLDLGNARLVNSTLTASVSNITITDNNVAVKCKITGNNAVIGNTANGQASPNETACIWIKNASTVIDISGIDSIFTSGTGNDVYTIVNNATLNIYANVIQDVSQTCMLLVDACKLFINANQIKTTSLAGAKNTIYAVPNNSGEIYINANVISGGLYAIRVITTATSKVHINSKLITAGGFAVGSYSDAGTCYITAQKIISTGENPAPTICSYTAGGTMIINANSIISNETTNTNRDAIKVNAGIVKVYNAELSRIDTNGYVARVYSSPGASELYLYNCTVKSTGILIDSTASLYCTNTTFIPNDGAVGCVILGTGSPNVVFKGCYTTIDHDALLTPLFDDLQVDTDIK